MTSENGVVVTIPADVQMIDETGYVWTFLHEAAEPDRVFPGALIVAGDPVEPFLARVVDIVDGPARNVGRAPRRARRSRGHGRRAASRSAAPFVGECRRPQAAHARFGDVPEVSNGQLAGGRPTIAARSTRRTSIREPSRTWCRPSAPFVRRWRSASL